MNLAKLFKLPKKLGDSMLTSLINNMVDYLRNYDSAIKVDDDGYIHLAADELYLEGNSHDIDIYTDNGIYLHSNDNITLYTNHGGDIDLESDNGINLNSHNECDIYINSDAAIQLSSGNTADIELISDGNINLKADNDFSIDLFVHGNIYERNLTIWADEDGLRYTQNDEIFFQIGEDGRIHGANVERTIECKFINNTSNTHDMRVVLESFFSDNDWESEVQPNSTKSGTIDIEYSNINCIGWLEVYAKNGTNINSNVQVILDYKDDATGIHQITKNYDFNTITNNTLCSIEIPVNLNNLNKITIEYNNDYCYTADTLITLADGSTKQVKDITYDDELKVWNFDEGKDDIAKPLWIKRTERAKSYQLVTLSDGNTIKLCGSDGKYHCMFDVTEQKFNHAVDCVGHEVYTENGITTVVSIEEVKEKVDHYNIVTNYHMNLYANHILTSTEKNNIYSIADMKFVKDDRKIVSYEEFEKAHISREYYDGWRAGEWNEPLKDVITHLRRRKMYAKPQKRVKDGLRTDYFG